MTAVWDALLSGFFGVRQVFRRAGIPRGLDYFAAHRAVGLQTMTMRSRPHIAVLDDEKPVRKALERLLRAAGMNVSTFASGGEFLSALDRVKPNCLILDLRMPGVDGFDVQASLKVMNAMLPVVVLTSDDTARARAQAIECFGATLEFLLKPVEERELLEAIARAMASSPR